MDADCVAVAMGRWPFLYTRWPMAQFVKEPIAWMSFLSTDKKNATVEDGKLSNHIKITEIVNCPTQCGDIKSMFLIKRPDLDGNRMSIGCESWKRPTFCVSRNPIRTRN